MVQSIEYERSTGTERGGQERPRARYPERACKQATRSVRDASPPTNQPTNQPTSPERTIHHQNVLHHARVVMRPVHPRRPVNQLQKRHLVHRLHFLPAPIHPDPTDPNPDPDLAPTNKTGNRTTAAAPAMSETDRPRDDSLALVRPPACRLRVRTYARPTMHSNRRIPDE